MLVCAPEHFVDPHNFFAALHSVQCLRQKAAGYGQKIITATPMFARRAAQTQAHGRVSAIYNRAAAKPTLLTPTTEVVAFRSMPLGATIAELFLHLSRLRGDNPKLEIDRENNQGGYSRQHQVHNKGANIRTKEV